jgi:hypothetical protein
LSYHLIIIAITITIIHHLRSRFYKWVTTSDSWSFEPSLSHHSIRWSADPSTFLKMT